MTKDFVYNFTGPNVSTYTIMNKTTSFSSPQDLTDHYGDMALKIAKDFSSKTKSVDLEQRLYIEGREEDLDNLRDGLKTAQKKYHTGDHWAPEMVSLVYMVLGGGVGCIAGGIVGFTQGHDIPSTILYTIVGVMGGGFVGGNGTALAIELQHGIVDARQQKKDELFEPLRKALNK